MYGSKKGLSDVFLAQIIILKINIQFISEVVLDVVQNVDQSKFKTRCK